MKDTKKGSQTCISWQSRSRPRADMLSLECCELWLALSHVQHRRLDVRHRSFIYHIRGTDETRLFESRQRIKKRMCEQNQWCGWSLRSIMRVWRDTPKIDQLAISGLAGSRFFNTFQIYFFPPLAPIDFPNSLCYTKSGYLTSSA